MWISKSLGSFNDTPTTLALKWDWIAIPNRLWKCGVFTQKEFD